MPRDLEIFRRESWFLREPGRQELGSEKEGPGYPIYYRFAISYSITMKMIEIEQKTEEWIIEELDKCITAIDTNVYYKCDGFLELLPFTQTSLEQKGFVLVDHTDSYYPLVFYPSSRNIGKPRKSAAYLSFNSVKDNFEQVFIKLCEIEKSTDWTEKFQSELYLLFKDRPKN